MNNIYPKNKRKHKDSKTLFETNEKHSKKFSDLINKYQTKIKKVWQVIKEGLGEGQVNRQFLIKKILQKIL